MASIFSRIVAGEIPCYKIAENERYFAFLDISPLTPGHTLVIPKREVDYLFDLDDEEIAEINVFAKKVAIAIRCYDYPDFNPSPLCRQDQPGRT